MRQGTVQFSNTYIMGTTGGGDAGGDESDGCDW